MGNGVVKMKDNFEDRFEIGIEKDEGIGMCKVMVLDKWAIHSKKGLWDIKQSKYRFCEDNKLDIDVAIELLKTEFRQQTPITERNNENAKV
jgi:hypothetical protein